jgi:hypothetical protein
MIRPAALSANIDVVDTCDGVRYVLHTSNNQPSNFSLGLAFFIRVPLLAAALAVWFLWRHFRQATPLLTALSVLFVAQMLFVARLPWRLFRQRLWQQLIARFGHGEIELHGDRLYLGNRVGRLWSGTQHKLAEFQRIVVYRYRESTPSPQSEPTGVAQVGPTSGERVVLAVDVGAERPWLLVDGFSRVETIALAEDLQRRVELAIDRRSSPLLPPPVVIETEQDVLYPPLAADFYRRRKPWWLAIHLAGAGGLAALSAVAVQVGAWQASSVSAAVILGWLLEVLLLGTTLWLPGNESVADSATA